MNKNELIKELERMIEKKIHKTGHDGRRYYLLSRDEIEEIIEVLENN